MEDIMSFLKKTWILILTVTLCIFFSGCPTDDDTGGSTETETEVENETGKGKTGVGEVVAKENINGQRVLNTLWGEQAVDPRSAMGYQLEDGTPFFDRYVVLYGGRIVNNDCATNKLGSGEALICEKTGLHLHYDDNVLNHHVLQSETYLQPLRQKGIKVLMGIVPKTTGVCVGILGKWPMEDVYPWAENNDGAEYPYGEAEMKRFAKEVVSELKRLNIVGVGYDEEYGNLKNATGKGLSAVYPAHSGQTSYYTDTAAQSAAWKRGGKNIFRFAYELRKEMPEIVQEVYEIQYGSHLPKEMEIEGKIIKVEDLFEASYGAFYGSWQSSSSYMPKARFGPVAIDIGATEKGAAPANVNSGITAFMKQHLAGDYGVNMFYCLRSREEMKERFPTFFTNGWDPANYLTKMSNILYGYQTVYVGDDYARLWW
jgi:hypothetical protein